LRFDATEFSRRLTRQIFGQPIREAGSAGILPAMSAKREPPAWVTNTFAPCGAFAGKMPAFPAN
jgi:hypothetical protein